MRQIRVSTENISMGTFFFSLALGLYIIRYLIRASLLLDMLPGSFSRMISICVVALLFFKVLAEDKYSSRVFVCILLILALVMVLVILDRYTLLIMTFALIASAYNVKFESVLRCMAISICIGTLIVVLSCAAGVIPDYTYSHDVVSGLDTGHSLGFNYYSTVGFIVMTLSGFFLYFHRKCGYWGLILLALINGLLFAVHTTTLAIVVGLVLIVAFIFTVRTHRLSFKRKIWNVIAVILPPVCLLLNLGFVVLFGNGRFAFNAASLSTMDARFKYAVQGLNEYGLHMLGSKIEMFGRTSTTYGDAQAYFYIDSAYMYTLIAYGILFTVVLLLLYMILAHYIYKLHDPYLFIWFAVIVIICMINNFILSYVCNPFLFLIPSALMELNRKRNPNLAAGGQRHVSTQR